jgi:quinol monooxygenase YgiN
MYTSLINIQFQPGKMNEAMEIAGATKHHYAELGCNQVLMVDQGNDALLVLAIYDSQAKQEAATPKAQELLERLSPLCATAPDRKGGQVFLNQTYNKKAF